MNPDLAERTGPSPENRTAAGSHPYSPFTAGSSGRPALDRFPTRHAHHLAFLKLAGSLALALLVASCSRKPAGGGRGGGPEAPVPILAAQVASKDVPVEIRGVGTVQAYSIVSVRPQITARIEAVHFHEGQDVNAGDLLFTLDARQWKASLNQAQANFDRDQAQLISARLEFERTSNLFQSKIASQQDYDTAEAAYQAQQATLLADSAAISNAEITLGYTEIRSPIQGRTGKLNVKAGNVVKSPDDVLVTVAQIHPIYVAFSVPEQHLSAIRREAREKTLAVQSYPPGETNAPAVGDLTFINNMVDTNTGTILLKATFSNLDNTLWPGQFVQTSLTISNLVNATVVPSQAVQSGQNGEFVFIVTSAGTAEMRPVRTGIANDGLTVIESDIKPGETVVTDGQLRLTPGAKVVIKTAEAAGLTNAPAGTP